MRVYRGGIYFFAMSIGMVLTLGCDQEDESETPADAGMVNRLEAPCTPGEEPSRCDAEETCQVGGCGAELYEGAVTHLRLGGGQVTDAGNTVFTVPVPEGAESFAVNVDGVGAELVLASRIESPSGEVVFDFDTDVATNRTDATDVHYTVLVPNSPEVTMESGEWTLTLYSSGVIDVTVDVVIKTTASSSGQLDVNLFFVGTEGLTAESAQADSNFQDLLNNVAAVYGGAGITLNPAQYIDITGDDADRLGVIDSIDGPTAELFELFALSGPQNNRAINFFFVADIDGGDAGFTLAGLSGGIPGPPGIHGTARSGVVVNMATYLEAVESGDSDQIESARSLSEIIFAHETGHYLGLFHTTERNGAALGMGDSVIRGADNLEDTPICPDSADANGNGILSASECMEGGSDNLLFWSPARTSRSLTSQQQSVLSKNPLIQ